MNSRYTIDKNFKFDKSKTSVWKILRTIVFYFFASVSLAILYYIAFSLIFNTDVEKKLKAENRMYENELPRLREKEALVRDAIEALTAKDNMLYGDIFKTRAPNLDVISSLGRIYAFDDVTDEDMVTYSEKKLQNVEFLASQTESNFLEIMTFLEDKDRQVPPMFSPLKDFTYTQTGASVGNKISPFYKVAVGHGGLDLIAPAGEDVYASGDGVVSSVQRSGKGLGNVVEITHKGGYRTRYAHLSDIAVRNGAPVKAGDRIGAVGMSGNSFAPHLHYEVLKDTLVLDPVNHFFASLMPPDYFNMLYLSITTLQSME